MSRQKYFPHLPWVSTPFIAEVSANLKDGYSLAYESGAITPCMPTDTYFWWKVNSQRSSRQYSVSVRRVSSEMQLCSPLEVCDIMCCSCEGFRSLNRNQGSKICEHETAVLVRCCWENRGSSSASSASVPSGQIAAVGFGDADLFSPRRA